MAGAFAIVPFVVVGVAAVAAVWSLATGGGSYDQMGGGRLSLDRHSTPTEREAEIRQMLGARNRRRAARGEAPLESTPSCARSRPPTTRAFATRSARSWRPATRAGRPAARSRSTSRQR